MSGIVGIVNLDGKPVDPELLAQMTGYMSFRGPDHQDVWLNGNVGFGHTLLRTTFESATERGVSTLDGKVWITADVRLDGRKDLIHKLQAKGCPLKADASDVELLLHAYHLWGTHALDHLMGDFAFGIWDAHQQRLFCAHDHFGVVPFYYARVHNALIFSNTLNTLRLHPAVSDRLNEQTVGDFLIFGVNWDLSTTTFGDINRLPPAHSLTYEEGQLLVQCYFQLPEETAYIRYKRSADYVEHFLERFDEAVFDRLRTNTAGTYLSGGMDSTSIAATAQHLLRKQGNSFTLRAYTMVYDGLFPDDEGRYAGIVAEHLGVPVEYFAAKDYTKRTPSPHATYLLPEPFTIPDLSMEAEITEQVAGYSRVLFAGFGGDPAFAPVAIPAYYRRLLSGGHVDLLLDSLWQIIRQRRLPRLGLRTHWQRWRRQSSSSLALPTWLQPDFVTRQDLQARWQIRLAQISPQRQRQEMLTAPLWSFIFAASDPGVTSFPLRVRFPFFDLRLLQYLSSVPPMPWFERKHLLRMAMRERLPQTVLQRPKTTLGGNPHTLLQQQGVQPWMPELLSTPALLKYVDKEGWLHAATEGISAAYVQSGPLFTFAYWFRHKYQSPPLGADSAL